MTQLTFSGRSDDGKRLLLVDGAGQEFFLSVDARLRRALGGEPDTSGQLEIPMESTLRPRDIQSRIRAGESPESVARAAGSTVEKIMPFAAPVLAERYHMAQRAQLSSVRRRSGDTGARTLGEAVTARLRATDTDPASVEWDAWRREDGRWTLTGAWDAAGTTRTATFSFDQRGNFVTIDDDGARWLVGDTVPEPDPVAADEDTRDELSEARRRRLGAPQADELPLGEDAIELVADPVSDPVGDEPSPAETTLELGEPVSGGRESDPETDSGEEDSGPGSGQALEEDPGAASAPTAEEQPVKRPRKRGRASVPSWDEIMFGGGKGD